MRGSRWQGANGALVNGVNNEDNKLANLTAGRWQAVARAERKLETPAIIAASASARREAERSGVKPRVERGRLGVAPPGTIIRCRGTLKYPWCPIGRRSRVTPLRYARERTHGHPLPVFSGRDRICKLFSQLSARHSFSLSLCVPLLYFFLQLRRTSATTQRRVSLVAFRRVVKESRTRFHVDAHRKQLNRRLNGPSIEDIRALGSDYEDTRYVG